MPSARSRGSRRRAKAPRLGCLRSRGLASHSRRGSRCPVSRFRRSSRVWILWTGPVPGVSVGVENRAELYVIVWRARRSRNHCRGRNGRRCSASLRVRVAEPMGDRVHRAEQSLGAADIAKGCRVHGEDLENLDQGLDHSPSVHALHQTEPDVASRTSAIQLENGRWLSVLRRESLEVGWTGLEAIVSIPAVLSRLSISSRIRDRGSTRRRLPPVAKPAVGANQMSPRVLMPSEL